ncbi:hypothetical protein [Archangium violaceum]|uniref:hypothetical protein n=1 Tax=Archangium violaceum TaxID=83451 RepID=UPI0036DE73FC
MRDVVDLTPDVVACVHSVREAAPSDYRQEKSRLAAAKNPANLAPHADPLDAPPPPPPVAGPEAFPQLHAQQKEIIGRVIECVRAKLDEQYPLLAGEKVEGDFATFLTRPYFNFPEGTAVVRRTTNMADAYYLLTNVRVRENGDLQRVIAPERLPQFKELNVKNLATKAAFSLASSIGSAVGGAIVSVIIDEFFPPGAPSYFDEVYQQMARITNKAIQEDKILSINGAINNVKQHLVDEYGADRKTANLENEADRQRLFHHLQRYDSTFLSGPGGMIGALQHRDYEVLGFGVFLLAASLQLALFQEMARVVNQKGNDGKWLKPHETSYGRPKDGTVALTARKFADYADQAWPKVLDARVQVIKWETYEANKRRIPGGDVYWEKWGRISDNGEHHERRQIEKQAEKRGAYPSLDNLKNDTEHFKEKKRRELTADYNDPRAIAGLWRKLIDQPIHPG